MEFLKCFHNTDKNKLLKKQHPNSLPTLPLPAVSVLEGRSGELWGEPGHTDGRVGSSCLPAASSLPSWEGKYTQLIEDIIANLKLISKQLFQLPYSI